MTRDQKIVETVQIAIDVLTGYLLIRRVMTRFAIMRDGPVQPLSTMG